MTTPETLSKPVLLCLHGWGGSKESFEELRSALEGTDLLILTPDLPGFGSEPEPAKPWTTDDYADWVEEWLRNTLITERQPLTALSLLGHSHGGRIAIVLAARQSTKEPRNQITHLYLCAAAGIRHRHSLKRSLGLLLAKTGKILMLIPGMRTLETSGKTILYKLMRVHDYENASPMMQKTMQLVTDKDLTPLLPHISVPTDIFWGTNDTMTPMKDGELMHRMIKGSRLHLFPGSRHRIHRDKAKEIAAVIRERLRK